MSASTAIPRFFTCVQLRSVCEGHHLREFFMGISRLPCSCDRAYDACLRLSPRLRGYTCVMEFGRQSPSPLFVLMLFRPYIVGETGRTCIHTCVSRDHGMATVGTINRLAEAPISSKTLCRRGKAHLDCCSQNVLLVWRNFPRRK